MTTIPQRTVACLGGPANGERYIGRRGRMFGTWDHYESPRRYGSEYGRFGLVLKCDEWPDYTLRNCGPFWAYLPDGLALAEPLP